MKPNLFPLIATLLLLLPSSHAAPSADAHIVVASEAGAKLDSDITKGGGTDETTLVQSILDKAPKVGALNFGRAATSGDLSSRTSTCVLSVTAPTIMCRPSFFGSRARWSS